MRWIFLGFLYAFSIIGNAKPIYKKRILIYSPKSTAPDLGFGLTEYKGKNKVYFFDAEHKKIKSYRSKPKKVNSGKVRHSEGTSGHSEGTEESP